MKKINSKGFTLVELLAVIIVLAIVVGITIPAVLDTLNGSKNKSTGVAVEAAQKYLENQLTIYNTDTTMADAKFTAIYTGTSATISSDASKFKAMGFKSTNVDQVTLTKNEDNTICVTITEIPQTSEYYTTEYWTAKTSTSNTGTRKYAIPKTDDDAPKNKSSHCVAS